MDTSFPLVLKAMRRNIYVHQKHWHAIIICSGASLLSQAWDETLSTFRGSKLGVNLEVRTSMRKLNFENGATLRFCVAGDIVDVGMRIKGSTFTHIVWLGDHSIESIEVGETCKRSRVVPPEAFLTHTCKGL